MINGTEQTEKLDIWTMGILMFELLHGKAPFSLNKKFSPRNKLQEIQRDILKGEITFGKGISVEAQEVIRAMMSPTPMDRPSSYELLTFPFFTNRYPFLASLNVKTSFINSKFFNKSKVSSLDNESTYNMINHNISHFSKKKTELDEREKKLKAEQVTFEKEKSEFYKRVIEFDKIKQDFRQKEAAMKSEVGLFRKDQEDLYSKLMQLQEDKKNLNLQVNAVNQKEEALKAKEEEVAERERDLEEQLVNNMNQVDKE